MTNLRATWCLAIPVAVLMPFVIGAVCGLTPLEYELLPSKPRLRYELFLAFEGGQVKARTKANDGWFASAFFYPYYEKFGDPAPLFPTSVYATRKLRCFDSGPAIGPIEKQSEIRQAISELWAADASTQELARDVLRPDISEKRLWWPGIYLNGLAIEVIGIGILMITAWRISLMRGKLRERDGRCGRCGYDLRGDRESGCPECGWRRQTTESAKP